MIGAHLNRSAAAFVILLAAAPPPPGRIIDAAGTRIHVHCAGHGRPAVVLIHGLGDYSFDWSLVQPAVAEQTEVCAYDRPGQAWSEPGPPPRGVRTSARELHELLRRMHLRPPYVLVGHSWGGLIARMYAHDYPGEVAGMVLVDSTHEDEYLWINGRVVRPGNLTDAQWNDLIMPHKRPKLGPPFDKLPPAAQEMRLWAMGIRRSGGGDTDDLRADFLAMHETTAGSEHPLGNMPLVVVSKTPGVDDDSDSTPEQLQWNRTLQDRLAALSAKGEHVVAAHGGHHVQLDDPEVVIAAIRRVIAAVRSSP